MAVVLFEDHGHLDLRPFTYTRPSFDLRCGIFTALERWRLLLPEHSISGLGVGILQVRYPLPQGDKKHIWINGRLLANQSLAADITQIAADSFWLNEDGSLLGAHFSPSLLPADFDGVFSKERLLEWGLREESQNWNGPQLRFPEDIFRQNGDMIIHDFQYLPRLHPHQAIQDRHTRIYGADNIFAHPDVKVRAAVLNAENGPIYLGPNSEVQEGAVVRGSHAFMANSRINMGAKMRGDTTVGPQSKIGGEVTNSMIMGCSNKGHEGYLGNSVLGYWCNLGADTNTSNLKNNYSNVKVWHHNSRRFRDTGMQFCGLMMGDHSKCGINTMFNTGTMVGVSANIFGSGYPRTYIPSFSWGGAFGYTTYRLKKALDTAALVMPRKGGQLDEAEQQILAEIYEQSAPERTWEKT
ncbi:MAG: putative sugar nucleotidyl transferase [Bacteroidota bacterium]